MWRRLLRRFGRGAARPTAGTGPPAVNGARRADWRALPPLRPDSAHPLPEVSRASAFSHRLAAEVQAPLHLAPLGHELRSDAPKGIVTGVARPIVSPAAQRRSEQLPVLLRRRHRRSPEPTTPWPEPPDPSTAAEPVGHVPPQAPQPASSPIAAPRVLRAADPVSRRDPAPSAGPPDVELPLRQLAVPTPDPPEVSRQPTEARGPEAPASEALEDAAAAQMRPTIGRDPTRGPTPTDDVVEGTPDGAPNGPGLGERLLALPPSARHLDRLLEGGRGPVAARGRSAAIAHGVQRFIEPASPPSATRAPAPPTEGTGDGVRRPMKHRPTPDRSEPPVVARAVTPSVAPPTDTAGTTRTTPAVPVLPVLGMRDAAVEARPEEEPDRPSDRGPVPVRWPSDGSGSANAGDAPAGKAETALPAVPDPPRADREPGRLSRARSGTSPRARPAGSADGSGRVAGGGVAKADPNPPRGIQRASSIARAAVEPAPGRQRPRRLLPTATVERPAVARAAPAPSGAPTKGAGPGTDPLPLPVPAPTEPAEELRVARAGESDGAVDAAVTASTVAAPADATSAGRDEGVAGADVDGLFRELYPRVRDELRWELRVQRERAGLLSDPL